MLEAKTLYFNLLSKIQKFYFKNLINCHFKRDVILKVTLKKIEETLAYL